MGCDEATGEEARFKLGGDVQGQDALRLRGRIVAEAGGADLSYDQLDGDVRRRDGGDDGVADDGALEIEDRDGERVGEVDRVGGGIDQEAKD